MSTEKELTNYEKNVFHKLDNWLSLWYPSAPKTNGLHIMRDTLEMYGAWTRFMTNFHTVQKRDGFIKMFEYILDTKDIKDLLQWAFKWVESVEGAEYWKAIDKRVRQHLLKEKEKGINLAALHEDKSEINILSKPSIPYKKNANKLGTSSSIQFYMNPVYALLSGATSLEDFITIANEFGELKQKDNNIHFDIPLSSTKIKRIKKKR